MPKEVDNAVKLLFGQLPTAGAQWASCVTDPGAPDTLLYNHLPPESPILRAERREGGERRVRRSHREWRRGRLPAQDEPLCPAAIRAEATAQTYASRVPVAQRPMQG